MKKYTKPTAEIIELSVKESLSALPNQIRKVTRNATIAAQIATATIYANDSYADKIAE